MIQAGEQLNPGLCLASVQPESMFSSHRKGTESRSAFASGFDGKTTERLLLVITELVLHDGYFWRARSSRPGAPFRWPIEDPSIRGTWYSTPMNSQLNARIYCVFTWHRGPRRTRHSCSTQRTFSRAFMQTIFRRYAPACFGPIILALLGMFLFL